MSGLLEIVAAALRAREEGRPAVLATVVKVRGSTYRRPGARMLIAEGGEPVGLVSGGCLEADLAERAVALPASGPAETVVYDMRSPDDIVWGLGLGCNGEVRVLLERVGQGSPADPLAFLHRCLTDRRPGVLVTLFDGRRLTLDDTGVAEHTLDDETLAASVKKRAFRALAGRRSTVERFENAEGLVEYVPPTVSLLVFGAGSDAVPLVRLAQGLGWRVTVADDRPALARQERFPEADAVELIRYDTLDSSALAVDTRTPVVVMTHHFLHDLDLLQHLLPGPAPYIGLLGPRKRTQNLLDELAKRGVAPTDHQTRRLFGPVGLDIGSETPEEIALSALAEIRAVLCGREGGFLRRRAGPLHEGSR